MSCSLLRDQNPMQCLANRGCSVNVEELIKNEQMNELYTNKSGRAIFLKCAGNSLCNYKNPVSPNPSILACTDPNSWTLWLLPLTTVPRPVVTAPQRDCGHFTHSTLVICFSGWGGCNVGIPPRGCPAPVGAAGQFAAFEGLDLTPLGVCF